MARGAIAKQAVIDKISAAFGADYIGEYDKKFYVWSKENGEKIQIAISLTCPKNQVAAIDPNIGGDFNFEDDSPKTAAPTSFEPAEITQEEKDNIAEMLARLNL